MESVADRVVFTLIGYDRVAVQPHLRRARGVLEVEWATWVPVGNFINVNVVWAVREAMIDVTGQARQVRV